MPGYLGPRGSHIHCPARYTTVAVASVYTLFPYTLHTHTRCHHTAPLPAHIPPHPVNQTDSQKCRPIRVVRTWWRWEPLVAWKAGAHGCPGGGAPAGGLGKEAEEEAAAARACGRREGILAFSTFCQRRLLLRLPRSGGR